MTAMGLDPKQLLQHVVRPALQVLGLPGGVLAEKLVLGTAAQEGDGFRYLHQLGKGPALSLWQIEPATAEDALDRAPGGVLLRLSSAAGLGTMSVERLLDYLPGNLYLGAAMCRLVYYTKSFRMPAAPTDSDWPNDAATWCAATWKRYYNTVKGAGTVEQFLEHWRDARLDSLWP